MINEFFSDKEIGYLFFIGLFIGVFCQPFVGALTDKINKRNLIIIFFMKNGIKIMKDFIY